MSSSAANPCSNETAWVTSRSVKNKAGFRGRTGAEWMERFDDGAGRAAGPKSFGFVRDQARDVRAP